MRLHLLGVAALGFLAAACQPNDQPRYSTAPAQPTYTAAYATNASPSEQVCSSYGFTAGTPGFDGCVQRERAARASGRVNRDYAQARLNSDAQNACMSYGLQPNSGWYNQCVSREIDARRYMAEGQPAAAYQTAPAYPSGYQPAPGYYQPAPASQYRTDQYGNRIDGQGYRVDAYGNRVS